MLTLAFIICSIHGSYAQEATDFQKRDTVVISSEEIKISAELGKLTVPENRHRPESRMINVDFVVLKSLAAKPGTPLIYLEGGGSGCTWQAYDPDRLSDWIPYLKQSDVILVDQRGTTDPDLLWILDGAYPENFLVSDQVAANHWRNMAGRALASFAEKGIDVTGYTVVETARDIDALRKALAIDTYSILGFSFGTHLGLTLIKLYPHQVKRAVLAGTDGLGNAFNFPSDLDAQVLKIAKLVDGNEQLRKDILDFNQLVTRVMKKLEQQPVTVNIKNPLTGDPMDVSVGAFGLSLVLRLDIDDATDIPVIPRLLYSIDHGDYTMLQWFVQKRVVFAFAIPGNGLTQGIASGASQERSIKIEAEAAKSVFKNIVNFPFWDVKDVWPASRPEIDFAAPLKSDVPTLFVSGDLDCRTPVSQTQEIKQGFSKSYHLIVKNAGHEQMLGNADAVKEILTFLSQGKLNTNTTSNGALHFMPVEGTSDVVSHPAVE